MTNLSQLFPDTSRYQAIYTTPPQPSSYYQHIPLAQRAAQFTAFAALRGFEQMCTDADNSFDNGINYEPSSAMLDELDTTINRLKLRCHHHETPKVNLTLPKTTLTTTVLRVTPTHLITSHGRIHLTQLTQINIIS